MKFSEKLQKLRKQKGLSQEQLAEILDVSRQSVSKWEAQQAMPEPGKIIMLSEIFNVSIDQLLKDDLSVFETDQSAVEESSSEEIDSKPAAIKLDTIFCTKCGKENRADSKFCGYCGNTFTSFLVDEPDSGKLTKEDMDLAYYKANLQMQQKELEEKQMQTELQRQQLKVQHQMLLSQRKQYENTAKCPRCGSTSLSATTKGYGTGKGLLGGALFGPLGLLAGNIGSKKTYATCMKCGYKFDPVLANMSPKETAVGCIIAVVVFIIIVAIVLFNT